MLPAYLSVTVVFAVLLAFSGLGKVLRQRQQVRVIHDLVGVPFKYFPLLAACEFAGALGLLLGIWWPVLGLAAGIGLVVYFIGAIVAHLRVGDLKGLGPAAFMLGMALGALVLRFRLPG